MLAFIQADESDAPHWWIVFGVGLGSGLLSKYAMVFFLMCVVIDSLWQKSIIPLWRSRGLWGGLALAAVIYLLNMWWNFANDFPSYRHTGEDITLNGDLFNPTSVLEFLGGQFSVFGPILFTVLLVLCWARLGRASSRAALTDHQRRLFAFSVPILLLITIEAFLSRPHANWAATTYIAGTLLVTSELIRLDKSIWLKASLAIHIVAAIILYNFDLIVRTFGLPIAPGFDPARRMRGWDRAGEWAAEIQRDLPTIRLLFDDRKVMPELLYYIQPHPFDAVMWNLNESRNNHYELTTDLSTAVGEDLLYIIRHDWPDRAATSFVGSKLIATFRSQAYTGATLELRAYLLSDFHGYQR